VHEETIISVIGNVRFQLVFAFGTVLFLQFQNYNPKLWKILRSDSKVPIEHIIARDEDVASLLRETMTCSAKEIARLGTQILTRFLNIIGNTWDGTCDIYTLDIIMRCFLLNVYNYIMIYNAY